MNLKLSTNVCQNVQNSCYENIILILFVFPIFRVELNGSRNTTVQSQRYVNDLEAQRKQLKARLHAEAENHKHYVNTANLSLQSVKVMFVILSLGVEPSFQLFSLGFQIIDVTLGLNSGIS